MGPEYYHCETFVYRCFAADGTLLYVGMTGNLEVRLRLHSYMAPWWSDVAYTTTESYPWRSEAGVVERRAIREEDPVHNVAGRRQRAQSQTAAS